MEDSSFESDSEGADRKWRRARAVSCNYSATMWARLQIFFIRIVLIHVIQDKTLACDISYICVESLIQK